METAIIHEDQLTNDPAPVAIGFDRQARIYGIGGPPAPELDSVGAVVEIKMEGSDAGKKCSKCGEIKNLSGFYTRKGSGTVRQPCRNCFSLSKHNWYINNTERAKENDRKWRTGYTEIRREKERKWSAANIDKRRAIRRKSSSKLYGTPRGKLMDCISVRMRLSLKMGSKAGCHWEALVGFTVDQLKAHLEKRFKPGMTWGNYGKWHIDHKIPIAAFNFNTPSDPDFRRCWCLKNLQPLWAEENVKKQAKLGKPFQPSLTL